MIGVYKIENKQTGDFYIGQSTNVEKRWRDHFCPSYGAAHSPLFQNHINQYGKNGFHFEVIEECGADKLQDLEAIYIQELNPTYNTIKRGRTVPQEVKKKISDKLKGVKPSAELVEKRRRGIIERHKIIPQTNEGHKKKVFVDMGAEGIPPAEFDSVKNAAQFWM